MAAMLSFEQAPPISVPFRFFLTAPLFGIAAGLYLALAGAEPFASRSNFPALALTHLLTLGFMLQAMAGALLQLSPVAAGANVWRPVLTGSAVHAGLVLGTGLLAAGFAAAAPSLFQAAVVVLAATLALYVAVVLVAVVRTPAKGPTVAALRLALAGLGVTAALGVALASTFGWGVPVPVGVLLPLHAGWGLIVWGLALLAGVAYLVVPMFQLTPAYPQRYAAWLPRLLLGGMALWSLLAFVPVPPALRLLVGVAVAALCASFALVTLRLQQRRRRKVADPTLLFFRAGMGALAGAAVLASLAGFLADELRGRLELAAGVLAIVGCYVSVINGMLYKIVPFISWLHLQKRMPIPPNMNQIIPDKAMRRQFVLHLAALVCLAAAVFLPVFAVPAGLLFAGSCLWLEWNLAGAMRLYWRHCRSAAPAPAC